MKKIKYLILSALFILMTILSCTSVPLTGRRQLLLIPDSQIFAMSNQEYNKFLNTNRLSRNRSQVQMVKRAGRKIQKAVERYFRQQGLSHKLKGYKWEFNLVESKQVNAWCMPGGKVVFYTGILPLTMTEEGLAVVMGHEIAHAVARHGNERMSQMLLVQLGGVVLSEAVKDEPELTRNLWMSAFGFGAQIGLMLPFSRKHEYEADKLGTIFMAMAGYNPKEAVSFWSRMAKMSKNSPPEFLSTHPSDTKRINYLKKIIPEALKYYK